MSWKQEENKNFNLLAKIEVFCGEDHQYDKYLSGKNKSFLKKKKSLKKAKSKKNNPKIKKTIEESSLVQPSQAWLDLSIPHRLASELTIQGFELPTLVQKKCIPDLIKFKHDSLVASETGSGKTLVFTIPLISDCLSDIKNNDSEIKKMRSLILTPTRELAVQICNMINRISKPLNVHCACIIGGLSEIKQNRILDKHPQFVVGTPGRLWTYFEQTPHEHIREFTNFKALIIDEVDRMTEQGHFEQLKNILDFIKKHAKSSYVKYVFSATLAIDKQKFKKSGQKSTFNQISKILNMNPGFKIYDLSNISIMPETLNEFKVFCDKNQRDIILYFALKNAGKCVIFVNSVETSDWLCIFLENLGIKSYRLNAKMDQKSRLELFDTFCKTKCVLIATDIISRGVDVVDVQTIIHYDVPTNPDVYIHRSGRTARNCRSGQSILFVLPESFHRYQTILSTLKRTSDFPEFPFDFNFFSKNQSSLDKIISITNDCFKLKKFESLKKWINEKCKAADTDFDPAFSKIQPPDNQTIKSLKTLIQRNKKDLPLILSKLNTF